MEKRSQCQTGLQHKPSSMQSRFVCAAPGIARCVQCCQHSLFYLRRLVQRGGRIIQIDHGLTTFPAWVSFSTMVYMLVTPPTASFSVRP